MRINRLHVTNFRGFKDQSFDFPRSNELLPNGSGSFHLIVGQNGKGKTCALEALAVAAGSWFLGVRGEDSRHIQEADVRVEIQEFEDTARKESQYPVCVEAWGTAMGRQLAWARELNGTKTNWIKAKAIKNAAEKAVHEMQANKPVTLPLICYFGTGRLWQEPRDMKLSNKKSSPKGKASGRDWFVKEIDDDLEKAFNSRLAGYRYSIDPRCNPRDMLRWLRFEQQLALQQGKESLQFKVVKQAILKSVEGCRGVSYDLRLGLLLEIEGQPRLPFGELSDGQRNMVAMVGDLAYKAAQLNPHLGKEVLSLTQGIVLIDELDLHLHPRWQRHVVEDLRSTFPEVQFIATTHSPFIIQSIRSGELISLDFQPTHATHHLGIEEIARGLMGVEDGEVSTRYARLKAAASEFLATLEEAKVAPTDMLGRYKRRLAESAGIFSSDPAMQALLEAEYASVFRERFPRHPDTDRPTSNTEGT